MIRLSKKERLGLPVRDDPEDLVLSCFGGGADDEDDVTEGTILSCVGGVGDDEPVNMPLTLFPKFPIAPKMPDEEEDGSTLL